MFKTTIPYFFAGAATCLLAVNILSSQLISPLYAKIALRDLDATVEYLKAVRDLPIYNQQLAAFEDMYGGALGSWITSERLTLQAEIAQYEKLLKKNPQSRDALYQLSLLFEEAGQEEAAKEYLNRAQAIDPALQ